MDSIDESILSLLKANSRLSNVNIAKKVGLSEGAVRRRIDNLVKDGVIKKFSIEVQLQKSLYAVLMAKARTETKKMMSDISRLSLHLDAYEISGEFDGCIIIDGTNMEEIDNKIDKIRKLKSVSETRTFISFRRY